MGLAILVLIWLITFFSTYFFAAKTWWLPHGVSTSAPWIDHQFALTFVVMGVVFVAAQVSLGYLVWKYRARPSSGPVRYSHGNTTLEILWTALTAILFIGLNLMGSSVWATERFEPAKAGSVPVEVTGMQFAWYFRYTGPDGKFGSTDPKLIDPSSGNEAAIGLNTSDPAAKDDVVAGTMFLPVNREVDLTLRAVDVIHSFFVPNFRFKQDAVPGLAIHMHFTPTEIGDYEIACAELCGLGHYQMHGTIMVFFVLTTAPQGGFGNYFLPIQIGAPDMAFPVLNMLSFWTTFIAFVILIAAFFVTGGAPLHGWTGYAPLSALPNSGPGEQLGADLWVTSIALFCVASLMGALNFITTTLDLRAKGMTLMRMPLTVWSWFITAILGLLAFGVLLSAGILLLLDRNLGTSFYVPLVVVNGQMMGHKGGSPLLWQHLFWFFGHPEVYIAILPGMGVTSQLISTFSRKPIFGYKAMAYALMSIGLLGFMVWGHHMFMSGMSPYSALAFSLMTMCIGVPSAIT